MTADYTFPPRTMTFAELTAAGGLKLGGYDLARTRRFLTLIHNCQREQSWRLDNLAHVAGVIGHFTERDDGVTVQLLDRWLECRALSRSAFAEVLIMLWRTILSMPTAVRPASWWVGMWRLAAVEPATEEPVTCFRGGGAPYIGMSWTPQLEFAAKHAINARLRGTTTAPLVVGTEVEPAAVLWRGATRTTANGIIPWLVEEIVVDPTMLGAVRVMGEVTAENGWRPRAGEVLADA